MLRSLEDKLRLGRGIVLCPADVSVFVGERTLLEVAVRCRLRGHPLTSSAVLFLYKRPIGLRYVDFVRPVLASPTARLYDTVLVAVLLKDDLLLQLFGS